MFVMLLFRKRNLILNVTCTMSDSTRLTTYTYSLTHSMQQSPSWEANSFSASREIPCILWNPKVHYRTHKCPSPVPILSHLELVHILTSHFLKIYLNIFLPSTPESPKWSLSLRFPHQNPVYASPLTHTHYIPRPSHYSRYYHPNTCNCIFMH